MIASARAQDPEWKVYATVPRVKNILMKYKDDGPIRDIGAIKNLNSRFLALVRDILTVQNAYFECKGFSYINVGYIAENGLSVDSGVSPESIKDLSLRAKYIERIAQNNENLNPPTSQRRGIFTDQCHKCRAQARLHSAVWIFCRSGR